MAGGLLFAGSLIVDRVKLIDYYPREGNLTVIREVVRATGGMATNNAINLKILDPSLTVGAAGRVGDDPDGELVLGSLRRLGVDCSQIHIDQGTHTSFTDVMTVRATGRRTFFHSYGACARFDLDDLDLDAVAGSYSYVQVGYHLLLEQLDREDPDFGTRMGCLLHELGRRGVRTSIDVVSEEGDRLGSVVAKTLPYVDDLIVNEIEAGGITGFPVRSPDGRLSVSALEQAVAQLFSLGVRKTVVIHAPEGAVGAERSGALVSAAAHRIRPEEIRGTSGAGDAFCSGVIYGLFHGWELGEALRLGNAMGALNLFHPSCTGGSKPLAEVREFMLARPTADWK